MIGHLRGVLRECRPERLVIDVGGVGYELAIPLGTYYALSTDQGGEISLHVHTHVREDAIQLYGFADYDERLMFERLIAISGVGPKLALAMLAVGADELRRAVAEQDRARLQKIPGIGKKTAERLLLELRDRIDPPAKAAASGGDAAARAATSADPIADDALSALVNLGYGHDVAERAVTRTRAALGDDATLEVVLRGALGGLGG